MIRTISVFVAAIAMTVTVAGEPSSDPKVVEYRSVSAALKALKAKPGVHTSVQDGWTVIEDTSGADKVTWNFTPDDHPAYPSVVKRTFVTRDGKPDIVMGIRCEAPKDSCDELKQSFQLMNEKSIKSIQGGK